MDPFTAQIYRRWVVPDRYPRDSHVADAMLRYATECFRVYEDAPNEAISIGCNTDGTNRLKWFVEFSLPTDALTDYLMSSSTFCLPQFRVYVDITPEEADLIPRELIKEHTPDGVYVEQSGGLLIDSETVLVKITVDPLGTHVIFHDTRPPWPTFSTTIGQSVLPANPFNPDFGFI